VTVIHFAWDFNLRYDEGPTFGVLSALGASMMILAGLIYLPLGWSVAIGVGMIVLHNLTDEVDPEHLGLFGPVWSFLHVSGAEHIGELPFYVSYPLIPWVGVMALGYGIGPLFGQPRPTRRRQFVISGVLLTLAFIVLRAMNAYGEPIEWEPGEDAKTTFMSFLNLSKYPPSLQYLLMTLGPALVLLAAFDRPPGPVARALMPLGRTALFFYVLHLYVIHALALGLGVLQEFDVLSMCVYYTDLPDGYGFHLPVVYLLWLTVLAVLYPACLWYAALKKKHKDKAWLSYL
jgi:uncharacterized membrane protein